LLLNICDDSLEEELDEDDDSDDDPSVEVIDEVVIGLLNVNCEICDKVRDKKGYKIHLAACRKKSLKSAEQAEEN